MVELAPAMESASPAMEETIASSGACEQAEAGSDDDLDLPSVPTTVAVIDPVIPTKETEKPVEAEPMLA